MSYVLFAVFVLLPAAFALAELGARAWLLVRGCYSVWPPHSRVLQMLDREALPDLPPLARFDVNGDGERGDPLPTPGPRESAPPDLHRVIALGGSSTECRYIDQGATWTAVAQRFLNKTRNLEILHTRRAHVGNVGRSLATCRHLSQILEYGLARCEVFDAVIVMAGLADVVQWLSQRAPPNIQDRPIDLGEVFSEHPQEPFGWTFDTLALRRMVSSWRRVTMQPLEVRAGAGRGIGRARRLCAQARELIDVMPDPKPLLEHFDRNFRELITRAQMRGRTVIVVRPCWVRESSEALHREHGWMFAAGDVRTEEVRAWYSHRVVDRLLDMVDRQISTIAREQGVAQLDPKPLFEPGFVHFYDEAHLNLAGCEILGQVVAYTVLRERLVRSSLRLHTLVREAHADVA